MTHYPSWACHWLAPSGSGGARPSDGTMHVGVKACPALLFAQEFSDSDRSARRLADRYVGRIRRHFIPSVQAARVYCMSCPRRRPVLPLGMPHSPHRGRPSVVGISLIGDTRVGSRPPQGRARALRRHAHARARRPEPCQDTRAADRPPPAPTPQQTAEARQRQAKSAMHKEFAGSYNVGRATIRKLGL